MARTKSKERKHARHIGKPEPLNPWHPARSRVTLDEVSPYMARMYNVAVTKTEVLAWATVGAIVGEGDATRTIYLKTHNFCGKTMVHKADLIKFCEMM